MRTSIIKKVMLVAMLVLIACSSVGVFATWNYSNNYTDGINSSTNIGTGLNEFYYHPEEILPDDEEASQLGENHLELINSILYEVSYGLNATKKPIIHNTLNKVGDVLYCEQNVQGGNLKHLMIDGVAESSKLLFQIEYVSETEYITYTYVAAEIKATLTGQRVNAYKTVMKKGDDNEWYADLSYRGNAVVIDPNSVSKGLDSSTWETT